MRNIVVVGATSGIGKYLAEAYAEADAQVVILGRRVEKLREIADSCRGKCIDKVCDITDVDGLAVVLAEIYGRLGHIDLLILSSGTGELNPDLAYELELPALKTNVLGWTYVVDWAMKRFEQQGFGHLASISSVGGLRGNGVAPAYNATKAFQMNYLEGMRQKADKLGGGIYITDIRPGFVDTAMAKGEGLFWVASLPKAGKQIYRAIEKKKKITYVTRRWRMVAFILKRIPLSLYCKM